jgi:maltose-binding protein MalE
MKKLMIATVVVLLCVSAAAVAQTASSGNAKKATEQADEKVKVNLADLPAPIKATLETEPYLGWMVESAYHNKTKNYYEVNVKKDADKKTLKFSKDGKAIE